MKYTTVLTFAAGLLPLAGCSYGGSTRAGPGPDYARHVFSLYDRPAGGGGGGVERGQVAFPLNVAVAELGEVAPPPALLAQLRGQPQLFRRAEGMPGIADGDYLASPYAGTAQAARLPQDRAGQSVAMRRLMALARDMGMQHLLLFGATVDADARTNGLAVLDLTIVGAYLVPSREVSGRARAAAVLIDLRGERVVLSAGVESKGNQLASAVSEYGRQDQLIDQLRDRAFDDLGRQIIDDCGRRAGIAPLKTEPAVATAAGSITSDRIETGTSTATPRDAQRASVRPVEAKEAVAEAVICPLPPDPVPPRKN